MTTYNVSSGETVSGKTVGGSDTLNVLAGARASATTVTSGGQVNVSGATVGTTLSGAGAGESVASGGVASGTVVVDGAAQTIMSGGVASKTTGSGGTISLLDGGTLSGGTITGKGSSPGYLSAHGGHLAGSVNVGSGGSLDSGVLVNGGLVTVTSGGQVSGTLMQDQSKIVLSANATGSAISAIAPGNNIPIIEVFSGAVVTSDYLSGRMAVEQVYGGTASGTHLISAGQDVRSGGVVYNTVAEGEAGNVTLVSGTKAIGAQVTSGAKISVGSGATASDSAIGSGGVLSVDSGGVLSGVTTLADGGSAKIWTNAGGTIDLQSTNVGLVVSGLENGGTLSTVISGFSGTDADNSTGIEIAGLTASDISAITYPDDDHVTLTRKDGQSITLNVVGVKQHGYALSASADGSLVFEVCFLAGSMIATPEGERAVEDIQIGDHVSVWDWQNNQDIVRPVVWVGRKHMTVRAGLADDEAGYPVRVLKNAVADGVPHKDLLITPEHSLFFEDRFVPVRMLVNGRSIFYDRSIQSYDYFHIETEQHSVLRADGMLTESYLNTGNRITFRQGGSVVSLGQGARKDWSKDGAAKLDVSRAFVEPLFRQIEIRAAEMGLADQSDVVVLTQESDLHLKADNGMIIRPARQANGRTIFMIPTGLRNVRIMSRTSRPSDVVGPFVDDRRRLGVLVGDIALFESTSTRQIEVHLMQNDLDGWDVMEASPCRWTNGEALLPLGERQHNSVALLVIEIRAAGPYRVTEAPDLMARQA